MHKIFGDLKDLLYIVQLGNLWRWAVFEVHGLTWNIDSKWNLKKIPGFLAGELLLDRIYSTLLRITGWVCILNKQLRESYFFRITRYVYFSLFILHAMKNLRSALLWLPGSNSASRMSSPLNVRPFHEGHFISPSRIIPKHAFDKLVFSHWESKNECSLPAFIFDDWDSWDTGLNPPV